MDRVRLAHWYVEVAMAATDFNLPGKASAKLTMHNVVRRF
jgi:hypothetical protein